MSRLIDADNLVRYVADTYGSGPCDDVHIWYRDVLTLLQAAPTADPVHAAGGCYCRECKYYREFRTKRRNQLIRFCYRMSKDDMEYPVKPNDFCSYGQPKEAQDDG